MNAAAPWASDPIGNTAVAAAAAARSPVPQTASGAVPHASQPTANAPGATPWAADPIDPSALQGGDDAAVVGRGLINGVPIVGPYLLAGADRLAAGARALTRGESYGDALRDVQGFEQGTAQQHPTANAVGQFGGAVLSTLPLAAAAPAAFGVEGATLLGSTMGKAPAATIDVGERDPGEVVKAALQLMPPPVDAMGAIPATVEKASGIVADAASHVSARCRRVADDLVEPALGEPE